MQPPSRLRVAPFLDAAGIVIFVLVGRNRHNIDEGASWFVTVLWPLFTGWFGVALIVRLYTRTDAIWSSLAITWLGLVTALLVSYASAWLGLLVASLLRGTFTDRPYFGIFTIIAVVFLGLTAFGWRALTGVAQRRAAAGAS